MNKHKMRFTSILVLLLFACNTIWAQDDYSFYLQKARQSLAEGDCDGAQRSYNVYKELSGYRNTSIEESIYDCQRNQSKVIPQTRTIPQGYVDLDLPSGTLWKSYNESGFYSYQEAVNKFGSKLPTRDQFEELIDNCTWVWNGAGYRVTGRNGNFIVLPAAGGRTKNRGDVKDVGTNGDYWSSISRDTNPEDAAVLAISASYHFTLWHYKKHGFSVRLVWN